ncbi:MAG: ATP-binding cassette domain-containing protein [Bacteroidia bacterium]|nr:ATP-binding cassette domain-containing protein [Bacteroidia bacterium]
MSEEILKALMQLFAIIAKQDGGIEETERTFVITFLKQQLSEEAAKQYIELFDEQTGYNKIKSGNEDEAQLTSVKDSVKILGLCKKINKTLTQNQKVVALVRLFELVNADRKFTDQRMAIINTVADVFKISKEEFAAIEAFVIKTDAEDFDNADMLIVNDKSADYGACKHIRTEKLDTNLFILRIRSVDLYFLNYTGNENLFLNGLALRNRSIYLFAKGSTVKLPKGKPIYYSDVVSRFLEDTTANKISYTVNNLEYTFPNGDTGLRNISFSEGHGKLIGIMGASGAGKTTLLNVLCGTAKPSQGEVLINGINLHTEKTKIEGVIGLIPQDDLLIEELTVFENLYYNAKLCFKDKKDDELSALIDKTLINLGLYDRKDLKVGSPLNKFISGGQRKRLNIALELIREPSILFVDEPTSGLSSKDSENVMDLLRELALKGKLIFVVIHQPSSEIYKMFDKMIILDTGGYMVYYGNPVEAVMYFKRVDAQINSDVGECPTCGNVNPEMIFNIIEAQVVDEFGNYTNVRKITPPKWEEHYREKLRTEPAEPVQEPPPKSLNIPNWFNQFKIYTLRDLFSKLSNTQYVILNLVEAPLLGLILSFLIRYIADPNSSHYLFRENENIPPYIFMCIVVALFLGLTVSAEEIFRDRKILQREKFLNLSRSSYLVSKITILFGISAIQAFLFVIVGNLILGIRGMFFEYWLVLFSIFTCANMMGLNISQSFNSAVTIYILIPLLMIPQMVLGGAMFSFDKLNRIINKAGKVPWVAEFMISRWAYESLMVRHFKNNDFEKYFYDMEKDISIADFKQVYYLPKLQEKLDDAIIATKAQNDSLLKSNLALLRNEIGKEQKKLGSFREYTKLNEKDFNAEVGKKTRKYLERVKQYYAKLFEMADANREKLVRFWMNRDPDLYRLKKNECHNEAVSDIAKKIFEKNRIVQYKDELIQQVHPIYLDPATDNPVNFRTHFLAPRKYFAGVFFDTFWFNIVIIWVMTIFLYITLYFEHLKKLLNFWDRVKLDRMLKKKV